MTPSACPITGNYKRQGPASPRMPSAARWRLSPRKTNEFHRAYRARGAHPSAAEHLSILPAVLRAQ